MSACMSAWMHEFRTLCQGSVLRDGVLRTVFKRLRRGIPMPGK